MSVLPAPLRSIVEATANGPPTTWQISRQNASATTINISWPVIISNPPTRTFSAFPPALLSAIELLDLAEPCWTLDFNQSHLSCQLSWSSDSSPADASTCTNPEPATPFLSSPAVADDGYFSTSPGPSSYTSPPMSPIPFDLTAVSEPLSTDLVLPPPVIDFDSFPCDVSTQTPSSSSSSSSTQCSPSSANASCQVSSSSSSTSCQTAPVPVEPSVPASTSSQHASSGHTIPVTSADVACQPFFAPEPDNLCCKLCLEPTNSDLLMAHLCCCRANDTVDDLKQAFITKWSPAFTSLPLPELLPFFTNFLTDCYSPNPTFDVLSTFLDDVMTAATNDDSKSFYEELNELCVQIQIRTLDAHGLSNDFLEDLLISADPVPDDGTIDDFFYPKPTIARFHEQPLPASNHGLPHSNPLTQHATTPFDANATKLSKSFYHEINDYDEDMLYAEPMKVMTMMTNSIPMSTLSGSQISPVEGTSTQTFVFNNL